MNLPQMVPQMLRTLEPVAASSLAARDGASISCREMSLHVTLQLCLAVEESRRETDAALEATRGLTTWWDGGDGVTDDDCSSSIGRR